MIQSDQRQIEALSAFQRVADDLVHASHKAKSMFYRLRKRKLVRGLYVWGGVGIGKTYLMDCFYQHLPFNEKLRLHFHAFMQYIHRELKRYQGKKNPIDTIAKLLSKKYRVICFDEFVVTDIVDAMILKNLLEALFKYGVSFVATSNTAPDDLYKNGLQRSSFIPAIDILKSHTTVLHIDSAQDYRMMQLRKSGVFFTPDNDKSHAAMEKLFSLLTHDADIDVDPLILHGRRVNILKRTDHVVWFHFGDICSVPRSQHDFLEIAKSYKAVFISGIPVFPEHSKNTVTLFIKLIDVFYDARVPVIFSAAAPIEEIGKHLHHISAYARTQSRLQEMQTEKYFSQQIFNV